MAGQPLNHAALANDISSYPSNPPRQQTAPIEATEVEVIEKPKATLMPQKQSIWRRIFNILIVGSWEDVRTHVIHKVIIPAFKNSVVQSIKDSVDIFASGSVKPRSPVTGGTIFNYSGISANRRLSAPQQNDLAIQRARSRGEAVTLKFDSEAEVDNTIDFLGEHIAEYDGKVTVADLYAEVGISSEHPETAYGWRSIADVIKQSFVDEDGVERWLLMMPRPVRL